MARLRPQQTSGGSSAERTTRGAGAQAFRLRAFGETFAELRRVTWPAREQVARLTVLVLVIAAVMGVFLSAVDWVFSWVIRLILFPQG